MLEQSKVGTKLVGFYRGEVKKHCADGRCKIFWPSAMPLEWGENTQKAIDMLPEAEQAAPLFAASHITDGMFSYPDIGTIVWGFFENGDINHPVYFASTLDSTVNASIYNTECNEKTYNAENYANNESKKTAVINLGSIKIKINASDKSLEILDKDTTSNISFSKEGISIHSPGIIKLDATAVEIKSNLITDVNSSGQLSLRAGGVVTPGNVTIFGNGVQIAATGAGVFITGTMDRKLYI